LKEKFNSEKREGEEEAKEESTKERKIERQREKACVSTPGPKYISPA